MPARCALPFPEHARGVSVGAHPSLFDRENFGRKELPVTPDEVFDAVTYQLGVFQAIAEAAGVQPNHIKPHGALYNMAVRDDKLADAIARATTDIDPTLILFAPDDSALSRAGESARRTNRTRSFRRSQLPRRRLAGSKGNRPDALARSGMKLPSRVLRMHGEGKVRSVDGTEVDLSAETICVHGDTPDAVQFARALRAALKRRKARSFARHRRRRTRIDGAEARFRTPLGPLDATIVIGSMIGSGIFITSAESARLIGAPGWLLLACGPYRASGLMNTITHGALCCSESPR